MQGEVADWTSTRTQIPQTSSRYRATLGDALLTSAIAAAAAQDSLDDLAEDRLGAWIPDVGDWFDVPGFLMSDVPPGFPCVQTLDVPRPDSRVMTVPVLHPGWHAALYKALSEVRDPVDATLDSAVFGYRRGASKSARYADLWRSFSDYTSQKAEVSNYVVTADIAGFFAHLNWQRILDSFAAIGLAVEHLSSLSKEFGAHGLDCPPSGYADARFLSNVVLHEVDSGLSVDFARWVDDYRLFVPSGHDPEAALDVLRQGLAKLGLHLNEGKTRIFTADEARTVHADTLASVYHPKRDTELQTKQRLRSVFSHAAMEPIERRRDLRFALRRLAKERDDVAIGFALSGLAAIPWEAPRLIDYLSVFADRPEVVRGVNNQLQVGARQGSGWLVGRIGALAFQTGISDATVSVVEETLHTFSGTPSWAMALRLLSYQGLRAPVERAVRDGCFDSRGALIALADIGSESSIALAKREPLTARALRNSPAPLPTVAAIL